ncbi:type I phosphomannose isomerase catalytic subunit [Lachnoclostridium sp. MSJ-17]|uniref:type I phosphomannose isomerase catalytic subunit n=1 Tax=Lachnoclostridium sp. MSJ-17 TaxID=2841516 RepID=UPI001C10B1D7|nr:type I phosphomannose isomerase catalytic subunit [Lachnoclostridium sp. MSJ-17]MBU5461105.1 class I mannose-6-phosphate isomerase [Lachnoclostridium sp. MSJ-17]
MYRTSRNSLSNNKNKPFLLKPTGKDYLWGGNRLNYDFGKNIALSPLSETWECSTHPDGPSTVASGKFEGLPLAEVLKSHPELLGTHPRTQGELPILIKLIDAKKDLSVQVHPDDEYAMEHENGQLGKTEMWYVLDAAPDTKLVYGLHHKVSKEKIRNAIETGKLEKYLQTVSVKKDDIYYIEAGTIHAIGAGALIAEIQENSNLTYRLYDYDRVDKNGQKRTLHVDKALEVANLEGSREPKQPMRVLKYRPGWASELLCRCKYFQVERIMLNTETNRNMVPFQVGDVSFNVLLCLSGTGSIFFGKEALSFFKGDCIFVPADSVEMKIHGKASMLKVSC